MNTVRIEYDKCFLDGHLAGVTVRAGYDIPDDTKHRLRHFESLFNCTQDDPKVDLSGNKYYVRSIYLG